MTVNRPALRYHGGKWRLAPWIISHFPPHVCYVEPFGGGASVLLRKPPSSIEVYNDAGSDVVNFFRVLRERPDELVKAIDLTPYSRAEYLGAQEPCDDPLERARRFYTWSWQGRGRAGVKEPGGWRFMVRNLRGRTPVEDWNNHHHLWDVAQRLKEVQFEQGDALTVIGRYDDPGTLFYVDPPYVQSTRGRRWTGTAYTHDYTDDDHRELAKALHNIEGMAIVSGYPSGLYEELYGGWARVTTEALTDAKTRETERLWISPRAQDARFPLFSEAVCADMVERAGQ